MIKKILIAALLFSAFFEASAQHYYRERPRERDTYTDDQTYDNGFKLEHLFIGGNLGLGYDGYTFNAGVSPEIGYSFAKWFDAGLLVNLNYTSERADPGYIYNNDTRYRSFNYGVGAFGRIYPLPFLFLQAGPEYNWVHYSATDFSQYPHASESYTTNAPSLLVGVGYGQRLVGRSSFHIAILIDALDNQYSPYRDFNGQLIPVLKAGFDIYFHPKKH
jgi:hypothetical protein